jgi:hypothetical protein
MHWVNSNPTDHVWKVLIKHWCHLDLHCWAGKCSDHYLMWSSWQRYNTVNGDYTSSCAVPPTEAVDVFLPQQMLLSIRSWNSSACVVTITDGCWCKRWQCAWTADAAGLLNPFSLTAVDWNWVQHLFSKIKQPRLSGPDHRITKAFPASLPWHNRHLAIWLAIDHNTKPHQEQPCKFAASTMNLWS